MVWEPRSRYDEVGEEAAEDGETGGVEGDGETFAEVVVYGVDCNVHYCGRGRSGFGG